MNRLVGVITLIVFGIILADVLANPKGAKAFFDGIGGLWKTSVNGLLGHTSK